MHRVNGINVLLALFMIYRLVLIRDNAKIFI